MPWPKSSVANLPADQRPQHMLCQAKRRKGQCGNFKSVDPPSDYCRFHGAGRAPSKRIRLDSLPRFYSKHLRGTLRDLVEEACAEDPAEQVELYEELAFMRRAVLDVVVLYEAAISSERVPDEVKVAAGSTMRAALKDVEYMVTAVGKLESLKRDKISVHNVDYVASQLTRIAFEVFGDDEAKAVKFRDLVQKALRVAAVDGVSDAPSRDVEAMDASVPEE